MYNRLKNTTLFSNVSDFKAQTGVTFAIHVFYTEGGTQKIMALAPPLNGIDLANASANNHPDQLYLALPSVTTKLALLTGKTIDRVEVDDTISFCGTGAGQCGKVVPEWVKRHFPTAPALLFLHKSDMVRYTLSGKHYFDLYDASTNDSWDWTEVAPVVTVAPVVLVPVVRYVAVYSCRKGTCPNKGKQMALIEVRNITARGHDALMFIRPLSMRCACGDGYSYLRTRPMLGTEPLPLLVELSS